MLLVEDNADDETLAVRALRRAGNRVEVVVARDGAEAISLGENLGNDIALVVLDLKLPLFDGFDVLKSLRSKEPTKWVPVVVLTSSDEPRDIRRSYELGANSYLRKPVEFDDYLERVSAMFWYWLVYNHKA